MTEDLPINRKLMRDLICRLEDPDEEIREIAAEALAVMAGDDGWRPDELIRQGGIDALADVLAEGGSGSLIPVLDVIIAVAVKDRGEDLISSGIIASLDSIRDHDDPRVREKARDALWLLEPVVEDVVMSEEQDEY